MNSLDDEVRYWKPNTYTGSFTESQMTVHAQGVQNQHGQLILEWSEPKKQQYTISGTNVTGGELSVEKDGDNIIPSGDDQYYLSMAGSSDGTNWTNITWASSKFIPNGYADKQIKALVTYNMKSLVDQVFQVETAAVTMNLFDASQYTWSVSGTVDFEQTLTVSRTSAGLLSLDYRPLINGRVLMTENQAGQTLMKTEPETHIR